MNKNIRFSFFLRTTLFMLLITMLVACGGGGTPTGSGGGSSGGSTTTGTATLSWTAPTAYTDDTVLNDLAGYKIYYGTSSASYDSVVSVTNPDLSEYFIKSLSVGTYYFVMTAYNDAGVESAYSNEKMFVVSL